MDFSFSPNNANLESAAAVTWNRPSISKKIYEISLAFLAAAIVISILFHVGVVLVLSKMPAFVKPVDLARADLEVELPLLNNDFKDAVETLQETAKERPKDAKFISSRNLSAEEDVSPDSAPTPLPQVGGGAKTKPKEKSQQIAEPSKTLFSLSQKDLEKDGTLEKPTAQALQPGMMSPGLYEKLKKGHELKLAAQESDFAQYIYRMKQKLYDRWSPRKLVKTAWYQFDEVRVDILLTLNKHGEIADLTIVNPSRFSEYDQEAVRAMRDSGPFPNPPKSLMKDDGQIYIPWSFNLYMKNWGVASRGIE